MNEGRKETRKKRQQKKRQEKKRQEGRMVKKGRKTLAY